MSVHIARKCDECGAVRGATNHWWCVVESAVRPKFIPFESAEREDHDLRWDYCSHACVGVAFHRWLDTGSVFKDARGAHEAATVS